MEQLASQSCLVLRWQSQGQMLVGHSLLCRQHLHLLLLQPPPADPQHAGETSGLTVISQQALSQLPAGCYADHQHLLSEGRWCQDVHRERHQTSAGQVVCGTLDRMSKRHRQWHVWAELPAADSQSGLLCMTRHNQTCYDCMCSKYLRWRQEHTSAGRTSCMLRACAMGRFRCAWDKVAYPQLMHGVHAAYVLSQLLLFMLPVCLIPVPPARKAACMIPMIASSAHKAFTKLHGIQAE